MSIVWTKIPLTKKQQGVIKRFFRRVNKIIDRKEHESLDDFFNRKIIAFIALYANTSRKLTMSFRRILNKYFEDYYLDAIGYEHNRFILRLKSLDENDKLKYFISLHRVVYENSCEEYPPLEVHYYLEAFLKP